MGDAFKRFPIPFQPAVEVPNTAGDTRLLGTDLDAMHLHGPVHVGLLRAGAAILVRTVDAKRLLEHPPPPAQPARAATTGWMTYKSLPRGTVPRRSSRCPPPCPAHSGSKSPRSSRCGRPRQRCRPLRTRSVNRHRKGTPHRRPKGTPLVGLDRRCPPARRRRRRADGQRRRPCVTGVDGVGVRACRRRFGKAARA